MFFPPFQIQGGDKLTLSLSGIKSTFQNNAMEPRISKNEFDNKVTNELRNDANLIPVTVTHFSDQRGIIERVVLPSTEQSTQNRPSLSLTIAPSAFLNASNDLKTQKSDEDNTNKVLLLSNVTEISPKVDNEVPVTSSNNPFINPFSGDKRSHNDSQIQQSLSTTNPFHSVNSNPFSGNNPFRNMDQAVTGDVITISNSDTTSSISLDEDAVKKTSANKVKKYYSHIIMKSEGKLMCETIVFALIFSICLTPIFAASVCI